MKILIITIEYNSKTKGGAYRSIKNLVDGLKNTAKVKVITQKVQNKYLGFFGVDSYLSIFSILKNILKFRPDIIITQLNIAFPTIIISKIMKIPVIHIIRDTSHFCPKYVDIIDYGKACSGLNNRKECFKCINHWRSLRVLIGNKRKGWENSLLSSFSNILYKLRYFICRFNLYLLNKSSINLVASNLMFKYLSNWIQFEKIRICNITPIIVERKEIFSKKDNRLLFIQPYDNSSYKGLDFILKLSRFIPEEYIILVVGGKIPLTPLIKKAKPEDLKGYSKIYFQTGHINYIFSKSHLDYLYQESKITLVPTFCTEAFGRTILESLVNKTPVISSPQCGINDFFKNKDFLKVIPLKINLWLKTIENILKNKPIITDNDISDIHNQFSFQKNKNDFIEIINDINKRINYRDKSYTINDDLETSEYSNLNMHTGDDWCIDNSDFLLRDKYKNIIPIDNRKYLKDINGKKLKNKNYRKPVKK